MAVSRRLIMIMACGLASPTVAAGPFSSCTLTLTTPGKLVLSGNGTTMGSQESGGLSAIMSVVGVALTPKLSFSALSVVGPTGWAGIPAPYLAVDSLSGLRVPYTATPFSITPGLLLDTLTLNAKIVNPSGFKAGNYTSSATVTCEAA